MAQRLLLAAKIMTDLLLTHARTHAHSERKKRFFLLPSKVQHGSGFDKRATPGDVKLKISSPPTHHHHHHPLSLPATRAQHVRARRGARLERQREGAQTLERSAERQRHPCTLHRAPERTSPVCCTVEPHGPPRAQHEHGQGRASAGPVSSGIFWGDSRAQVWDPCLGLFVWKVSTSLLGATTHSQR